MKKFLYINLICAISMVFFDYYPKESDQVIADFYSNKSFINENLEDLSTNEKLMALSIVAPEYSQFSKFSDFFEMRTLCVMYLNSGASDFSVGPFQMKPSFVEEMENYVNSHKHLKNKYKHFLPHGSERDKRKYRLEHLFSYQGQLQYLELFISIAKSKTQNITFKDSKEQLLYWATLYNTGINCSHEKIVKYSKIKGFPINAKLFNYAEVSYEFYLKLHEKGW